MRATDHHGFGQDSLDPRNLQVHVRCEPLVSQLEQTFVESESALIGVWSGLDAHSWSSGLVARSSLDERDECRFA